MRQPAPGLAVNALLRAGREWAKTLVGIADIGAEAPGHAGAMNYRHAYHAGNFADVLKHAVLARVIDYLRRKDAPFRIIDTHAGAGRYALTSPEAGKTGEWQGGIGRLVGPDAAPLPARAAELLQPYLDAVRAENGGQGLTVYPGSPCVALALMRAQDVLIANELHPEELAHLKSAIGGDRRAKTMALDAWVALKALLPPRERRGVILIDPPFEQPGELERVGEGLAQALKRFATGVYMAWYPIKDPAPIARFHADLQARMSDLGLPDLLRVELFIQRPDDPDRLNGCGLVVANPPYTLEAELDVLLPELTRRMAVPTGGASHRVDHIVGGGASIAKSGLVAKRRMRSSR